MHHAVKKRLAKCSETISPSLQYLKTLVFHYFSVKCAKKPFFIAVSWINWWVNVFTEGNQWFWGKFSASTAGTKWPGAAGLSSVKLALLQSSPLVWGKRQFLGVCHVWDRISLRFMDLLHLLLLGALLHGGGVRSFLLPLPKLCTMDLVLTFTSAPPLLH